VFTAPAPALATSSSKPDPRRARPRLRRGVPSPRTTAIEDLLEGKGLAKKPAALALLSGLGAKISRASDLPSPSAPRDRIPTQVPALDRLLSGGLPRGGLVELTGRRSCGRFSIGISALAAATSSGEAAALVDLGGHLDPQAAEEAGVDLTRLLWVRPEKLKGAVASAEMLLATGFALVVVDLGLPPVRGRFVPDAAWLRLERAARSRGAALFVLAPYRVSGIAADAVVSAGAAHALWKGTGRAPRLLDGVASRLEREGAVERMALAVAPGLLSPPFGGRGLG
jgi:recA bacterial DNA recombination protein